MKYSPGDKPFPINKNYWMADDISCVLFTDRAPSQKHNFHPKMQRILFLLLSCSIVLSLSNPIAEQGQILTVGDVIAVFDADEPDQPAVLFLQQAPMDESPTLRGLTPEESKNKDEMTEKNCEGCDSESGTQERSFLFKKLFLSQFVRPVAVPTAAPAPARPVAPPSAFLIGTIYQPTSFVAAPIRTTGSTGLSTGGQATLALPTAGTLPSLAGQASAFAGISGLQLMQAVVSGGQSAMQIMRPSAGLPTAGANILGTGMAGQQLPQMPFAAAQPAMQMATPSSGFSPLSVGAGTGISGLHVMQALVPAPSTGTQPTALQPSTGSSTDAFLAVQGPRPTFGMFPNPAGQGNIGINIQQSGMSHPSNGPTPNSVANINITTAEASEAPAAELPESTGVTSRCSSC